jgi:hypothetical protein
MREMGLQMRENGGFAEEEDRNWREQREKLAGGSSPLMVIAVDGFAEIGEEEDRNWR